MIDPQGQNAFSMVTIHQETGPRVGGTSCEMESGIGCHHHPWREISGSTSVSATFDQLTGVLIRLDGGIAFLATYDGASLDSPSAAHQPAAAVIQENSDVIRTPTSRSHNGEMMSRNASQNAS